MTVLSSHCTISSDWTGSSYLGIDLDWDYEKREFHLSMLSYVQDKLTNFHHSRTHKLQYQPYPHAKVTYGDNAQYATAEDDYPLLFPAGKNSIQEVNGTYLYFARDNRRQNATGTGIACNPTGRANRKHHDTCKTIYRLWRNSPRCNHNVPRLRHGSISPTLSPKRRNTNLTPTPK